MFNLLYCEIIKMKHSKMFLISVLGAITAPFMCFIGTIKLKIQHPSEVILFSKMFSETNLYIVLLIGVILYGVMTAYLINREYAESTLKAILTIPVSKTKFILGKYMMLFLWIMALTLITWGMTLVFGFIVQLEGLNLGVAVTYLKQFLIGGSLMFLLTTPFIFITLVFKNLFPAIVLSAVITMGNMALVNDIDLVALYPWSATYVIASDRIATKYPITYSIISIAVVSLVGFILSLYYFKKTDVQ